MRKSLITTASRHNGKAISLVAKNSRLTNNPWGYTGESHNIEARLVYLRARYLEPETGRLKQQNNYLYFDEIDKPLNRNLYAYQDQQILITGFRIL